MKSDLIFLFVTGFWPQTLPTLQHMTGFPCFKREILYINAYIWNLERWYWLSYLQGIKGDTDVKKRLLDSGGEGEGGMIWENSIETYTLPYVKQMTSVSSMHEAGPPKAGALGQPRGVGWGGRWEAVQDEGNTWITVADSCWCMKKPSQRCKVVILQLN